MASTITQLSVLAAAFICISLCCCKIGMADEYTPETGYVPANEYTPETGDVQANEYTPETGKVPAYEYTPETGNVPEIGTEVHDPTEIVAKALLCFNDKYVYSSCEESYRLNESGDLKVPEEKTDEYCKGPCLTETYLVLDCLDHILSNFLFYNKATIQDVRKTIQAACGHGEERGNFNVAEHMQTEGSNADKVANQIGIGIMLMIVGNGLLF